MKEISIGGQALIEGVMMKTATHIAAAARKPDKSIVRIKRKQTTWSQRFKLLRLPIVRGAVMLAEMLVTGIKMIDWSAHQQEEKPADRIKPWQTSIALLISLSLAIALFVLAPYLLTRIIVDSTGLLFNLVDGAFRIAILVSYVWLIGLFKDVRRMYQYHGAEHMTVHCYEHKKPLIPANVKKYSPVHPRCGTSLLMFVVIVSILVFSLVREPRWFVNVPLRILLIPLIAGISYELLKLSARWPKNPVLKMFMLPGLWVQKITTRKPDKKQIEVAIAALKQLV